VFVQLFECMAKIRLDLGYVQVQDLKFKDVRMIIKPKSISISTLHNMFWMKTSKSIVKNDFGSAVLLPMHRLAKAIAESTTCF